MSYAHAYTVPVLRHPDTVVDAKPAIRVALVGGFRPTKCGLATFTTDVFEQMSSWLPDLQIDVYAMVPGASAPAAPEVTATILQHDAASYAAAARRMNADGVDVVWIQHEFGIYGGAAGMMVLDLINMIAAPVVVTLHTVLQSPSPEQRQAIDQMRAKASRFVVMSKASRDILIATYGVDAHRVHVIEHGAPDRPNRTAEDTRAALGMTQRPTIMTFGLLGPGKGLEVAIRAMPGVLQRHPEAVYRIVGATHPNLVAAEGETYREGLKALAAELGVEHAIEWVEEFLETDALLDQLASCDIYLTPYLNLGQSTSGTLSYAVALGCAVVSTPYAHARELLANGVGVLVEPNNPDAIAVVVNELFDAPTQLTALRSQSYARGRSTIWSAFAARSGGVVKDVLAKAKQVRVPVKPVMPSTAAFLGLIDDVGMLQHSVGIVPDRHHGYCIDDNARALILVNQIGRDLHHLAPRFAAFLQHGWNNDARRFRNFMSYDRRWLEPLGSEDSNGRTLWAIGYTALTAHDPRLRNWATALFERSGPHLCELTSPRAMAFLTLGAAHMLAQQRSSSSARMIVDHCAKRFGALLAQRSKTSDGWMWFEDTLSYDNARVPQALFVLSTLTGDGRFATIAGQQLKWLCDLQTSASGVFRPIGSEGFQLPHASLPFDQQPLEAWATIDACSAAMAVAPSEAWRVMAHRAYDWYLGGNDRAIVIGDPASGSCCDGLMAKGSNANTGAESVLSFSLAYQSLIRLSGGQTRHADSLAQSDRQQISRSSRGDGGRHSSITRSDHLPR